MTEGVFVVDFLEHWALYLFFTGMNASPTPRFNVPSRLKSSGIIGTMAG